jgi:hypothetical protein
MCPALALGRRRAARAKGQQTLRKRRRALSVLPKKVSARTPWLVSEMSLNVLWRRLALGVSVVVACKYMLTILTRSRSSTWHKCPRHVWACSWQSRWSGCSDYAPNHLSCVNGTTTASRRRIRFAAPDAQCRVADACRREEPFNHSGCGNSQRQGGWWCVAPPGVDRTAESGAAPGASHGTNCCGRTRCRPASPTTAPAC